MTRHDDDIPREPFDCLDLRNHPDGKGPLAKVTITTTVTVSASTVLTGAVSGERYKQTSPPQTDEFGNIVLVDSSGKKMILRIRRKDSSSIIGGDVFHVSKPVDGWFHPGVDGVQQDPEPDPESEVLFAQNPGESAFEIDEGNGDERIERTTETGPVVKTTKASGGRNDIKLIKQLQMFLVTLGGFDLGKTGSTKDGVDGAFGEKTDAAVKDFQRQNKDFNGEQLKQDGKVGPKTSDALNRAMVGVANDDNIDIQSYLTPLELTKPVALGTMIRSHVATFQAFGGDVKFGINKLVVVVVD